METLLSLLRTGRLGVGSFVGSYLSLISAFLHGWVLGFAPRTPACISCGNLVDLSGVDVFLFRTCCDHLR